jgi:hypothetical protein
MNETDLHQQAELQRVIGQLNADLAVAEDRIARKLEQGHTPSDDDYALRDHLRGQLHGAHKNLAALTTGWEEQHDDPEWDETNRRGDVKTQHHIPPDHGYHGWGAPGAAS